jgi:NAD(P)-dependent dehydrogenase (short-subunit alcohol dehydrogenase family)
MTANKAYAIIAGVGAGTGASIARRFAQVRPPRPLLPTKRPLANHHFFSFS